MTNLEVRDKMQAAIDHFSGQLVGIRGGTISAGVVDTVKVSYYGQPTPIQHLACSYNEPGRIVVKPHNPGDAPAVVAALKAAGFDAYVFSKGTVVVNRPPPSGEDRKKVETQVKKLAEDARVAIRNIRKNCKQKMTDLSAEEKKQEEKRLQILTDESIEFIDEIVREKLEAMQ